MSIFEGFIASTKEIVNLTPHDIIIKVDGEEIVVKASGQVARVKMEAIPQNAINGKISVVFNKAGEIENLPLPETGKVFLVSIVVLGATNRADVFAPDTGTTCIRNEKGQIIAVTQLVAAVQKKGQCAACGMIDDLAEITPDPLCFLCAEGLNEE